MSLLRRRGFTIIELMMSVLLLALITAAAWTSYSGGMKETDTAGDYLSAMQSAAVLMESIQEDVRQLTVLNELNKSLIPYSLYFSKHGKSMMFRKASVTNTDGEMAGSSFTVVVYQMVKHPTEKDVFNVRRIERTTDGNVLPNVGRVEDEKYFKALLVRDIRFDLLVKFEQGVRYRTFIRVSLTATNTGAQKDEPRVYLVSNVFEATSPEFINNDRARRQVGFSRRFILGNIEPTNNVKSGEGFYLSLPPSAFGDLFDNFDYEDTDGRSKDFPDPPGVPPDRDPFDVAGFSAPPLRQTFVTSATEWFGNQVGPSYRGRILVQVNSAPTTTPAWTYGFSLDCSNASADNLAVQLNKELTKIISDKGAEGVEQTGHAIGATAYDGGLRPDGTVNLMITRPDADKIVAGQ